MGGGGGGRVTRPALNGRKGFAPSANSGQGLAGGGARREGGTQRKPASAGHKAAEPRSPIPAPLWASAVPLRAKRCAVSLRQVLVVSVF